MLMLQMKHTVVSLAGGEVECLEGNNRVVTHNRQFLLVFNHMTFFIQ